MDYETFHELVKQVKFGKHLPAAVYVHQSALNLLPEKLSSLVLGVAKALNIGINQWQLLKFYKRDFKLTLLCYPSFFEEPYPPLNKSYTIDLAKLSVREADYSKSENPPILHRRETFFAPDHPQATYFNRFTQEGEALV